MDAVRMKNFVQIKHSVLRSCFHGRLPTGHTCIFKSTVKYKMDVFEITPEFFKQFIFAYKFHLLSNICHYAGRG